MSAIRMETLLRVSQPQYNRCIDTFVPPATGSLSFLENLFELSVLSVSTVSETVVRDLYHIKQRQFPCKLTPLSVREDYQTIAVNKKFHVCKCPAVHLSSHPVTSVLLCTRTKIHDWRKFRPRDLWILIP